MTVGSVIGILLVTLVALSAFATSAEFYFATDSRGANRVTAIQEGTTVWLVVYDPDENISCDDLDKIWTDVKVMDPKTGAYITWVSYPNAVVPVGSEYEAAGYIPFQGHEPGIAGDKRYDYFEETGADTGLFVSHRSFQIGTRESAQPLLAGYDFRNLMTHVVDDGYLNDPAGYSGAAPVLPLNDFNFGNYLYNLLGVRGYLDGVAGFQPGALDWADIADVPPGAIGSPIFPNNRAAGAGGPNVDWLVGAFSNMDTLTGLYLDPNDPKDIACAMAKIIDTVSTCSWSLPTYKDANGAARITIVDPDENLNCNQVEYVPVFVIVNPGSWNPVDFLAGVGGTSPTNFCMLLRTGGIDVTTAVSGAGVVALTYTATTGDPIAWWNIYNSLLLEPVAANLVNNQPLTPGAYYIQYPTAISANPNVTTFDTTDANGVVMCSFYAMETGVNTGIFEYDFNNLARDLGFNTLDVNDVIVAYYIDPNDDDDMTICTACIESCSCQSTTTFTDVNRTAKETYWIGRDPVYVQVIDSNANVDSCCPEQVVVHICDPHEEDDSEWVILDETSSNSPVFFTNNGYVLLPVWDAMGIGVLLTGYQLVLDNWKLEVFNEDTVYARYNDAQYQNGVTGLAGLGDQTAVSTAVTAFPPEILLDRVDNDVSFDLMHIGDTQVFNGSTTNMWFLDRGGNRVSGYTNSDCIFIEVLDPDQNEDTNRRERVDGYWDHILANSTSGQNWPFGPGNWVVLGAPVDPIIFPAAIPAASRVNYLLGTANTFNPGVGGDPTVVKVPGFDEWAKIYVLNPRTGLWAALDLLETAPGSGDFVSVTCVDLVSQYAGVPTLGVIPNDTIIAFYQDPSNHSDVAMICIKVNCGGGGSAPGTGSTTKFANATGAVVTSYLDVDQVYVKVVDPSHAGAISLLGAVTIGTATFDLAPLAGGATDTFITRAITMTELAAHAGSTLTATYKDPVDTTDISTATASVNASVLHVDNFYAKPNPFKTQTVFTYKGTGIATTISVAVYDLGNHLLWSQSKSNATEITWDGKDASGTPCANGAYAYVMMAKDGTNTFTGKGKVFINR